jgi:uncharacterized delta-60 repeat protein
MRTAQVLAAGVSVTTLLVLPPVAAVVSPPGPLDHSFGGGDGVVTTAVGPRFSNETALAMVAQPDGRLVVGGVVGTGSGERTGGDFLVVRYLPDGRLDPVFGGDGIVTTDIVPGPDEEFDQGDEVYALALQPDGKIVAAGTAQAADGFDAFAVVRYLPDGSLDAGFGDGGVVTTHVSTEGPESVAHNQARAVALQPDGRIVVVGAETHEGWAVARYLPDGSLDPSFSGDGTQITSFLGEDDSSDRGGAYAVVVEPDGGIVVAGAAPDPSGSYFDSVFGLARYLPDGTLDPGFSGDGLVTTGVGEAPHSEVPRALVRQDDGRLLAVGEAMVDGHLFRFGLARWLPDGRLDPTFGGDGTVLTNVSPIGSGSMAHAVAMQGSRIVAVGMAANHDRAPNGTYDFHPDFATVRYLPDGRLDATFGGDGKAVFSLAPDIQIDSAQAVVVDDDGIVVAGYVDLGPEQYYDFDLALVRYGEDTTPPDTRITVGPGSTTRDRTPTFRFRGTPSAFLLECARDKAGWGPCTSPLTMQRLALGRHVFRVRATDEAGNTDPTPARLSFRVVRQNRFHHRFTA